MAMRLLHFVCVAAVGMCGPAYAGGSYVTPDGLNRAAAVTLHCAVTTGTAAPCGVAANPLVVSPSPGGSSSSNQLNQIAVEQSSAQGIGSPGDSAFNGGNGSLISLLKGLWFALSTGVPAVPSNGVLTSRTVTLTGQQSFLVFPANPSRRYLSFQVPQSTFVWVNLIGGSAVPNGPDCAYFAPGTFYESGQFVNRGAIAVYAPVAVTFSAWEG